MLISEVRYKTDYVSKINYFVFNSAVSILKFVFKFYTRDNVKFKNVLDFLMAQKNKVCKSFIISYLKKKFKKKAAVEDTLRLFTFKCCFFTS